MPLDNIQMAGATTAMTASVVFVGLVGFYILPPVWTGWKELGKLGLGVCFIFLGLRICTTTFTFHFASLVVAKIQTLVQSHAV